MTNTWQNEMPQRNLDVSLQKRIKQLREKSGLTLEELAEATDSTKSYVWELENKPSIRPSARKIMDMAAALETTVDYLMDGTGGKTVNEERLIRVYRKLAPGMQGRAFSILKCLS